MRTFQRSFEDNKFYIHAQHNLTFIVFTYSSNILKTSSAKKSYDGDCYNGTWGLVAFVKK